MDHQRHFTDPPSPDEGGGGLEDTLLRETIDEPGASSSRVEDVDALPRGAMIDRYVVLQRIGAGGMGVVYAAYDPDLDRRVALKVLRARVDGGRKGEEARARLMREGQAMAKVRHPNVIAVHDVGTDEQRVFIAMEFIDGCTLGDWLVQRSRSREEILGVYRAAGEGLAAAHRQGLIHRDFKPDNVLIGRDGRICVVDFGLARRESLYADEPSTDPPGEDEEGGTLPRTELEALEGKGEGLSLAITRTGMLLGTPAYMAPEQHLGLLPGPAADQFAFCVALYEALYGERPFAGSSPAELLCNVTEAEVRPPPASARVPAWIRRVLLRGLHRKPRERWPEMDALLQALDRSPRIVRRRVRLAAVAGVLAVGGGVAAWASIEPASVRCEPDQEAWAEVWSEAPKARYLGAFRRTGKAFADEVWGAVERDGDAYVEQWQEQRVEACRATHALHTQSPELLALREACLGEARERLVTLTELWLQADEEVVVDAVDALGRLPSPAECGLEEVLRARARLPADPEARRELAELRRMLDRARTLARAHRLSAASRLVEQVLARAQALDVLGLEGEALLARADVEEARGELERARHSTHAALLRAEAADDDELAVTAWIDLLWLDGYRGGRSEAGHAAADHALALLSRWPDAREQEVLLVGRLGDLLYAEGRYAESLEQHRRALGLREQLAAPHDPRRADALTGMGLCELELGRLDDALDHLTEAEAVYREAYGAGHPHIAAALTNLGTTHDHRGEYERALAHHERALEVAEAAHGLEHPAVAEILNNLAGVLVELRRLDQAEGAYVRAQEIWRRRYGSDHPDLAMIAFNLGVVAHARGDRSRARVLHEQARQSRVRGLGPTHPDVADSLEALAELDRLDGDFDGARVHLGEALAIREAAFGSHDPLLAPLREQLEALPQAEAAVVPGP